MQASRSGAAVHDVASALVLLVRSLKGLHARVTARVGLRVELPAFIVLTSLEELGPVRASELADLLRLDLSGISRQVSGLEREGWVERAKDPADSRAQLLRLTPSGLAVLQRVRQDRAALLGELLPEWTDAELHGLAQALRRFSADVGAAPSPAAAR